MGIPILVQIKLQEIFQVNGSATKIHGESHSCINMHTVTVPYDSVCFHAKFLMTALLVKLPNTSTRGFLSM